MTRTLEPLWLAAEQDPSDWDRWLVLADALNDISEERVEKAVRWMVQNGKIPVKVIAWWWYCESEMYFCGFEPSSCLPRGMVRYAAKSFDGEGAFYNAVSWLADQLERMGL